MTTYIIKKNGKRYNSKNFETYEQARSYIRKKLRGTPVSTLGSAILTDVGWGYSNPSHSRYGFTITKVEQTTKKAA